MIRYYEQRFYTVCRRRRTLPGLRTPALPGTRRVSGPFSRNPGPDGDSSRTPTTTRIGIPPYAIYDGEGLESHTRIPPVADTIVPGHGRPFSVREGRISYVGEQKPVDMMIFPNLEHLDALEERACHRIIL